MSPLPIDRVHRVRIADIDATGRLREVDPAHVHVIADSIQALRTKDRSGLKQAITIRPIGEGKFKLVIGAHRLAACSRNIVRARWAAMWLLREARGLSTTQIGDQLGGKDHTTVVYGLKMVEERRDRDPAVAARLDALLRQAAQDANDIPADQAPDAAHRLVAVLVEEFRTRLRRLAVRDPQAFITGTLALFAEGDSPCAP